MINTWQAYLTENEGRWPLSKSAINTLILFIVIVYMPYSTILPRQSTMHYDMYNNLRQKAKLSVTRELNKSPGTRDRAAPGDCSFVTGFLLTKQSTQVVEEFSKETLLPGPASIAIIRSLGPLFAALISLGELG